jgi:hypothetical protein
MEASETRAPLLENGEGAEASAWAATRRGRNSVGSMKGEFVARLPKKVRECVDLEEPYAIDVSRSKGLIEGTRGILLTDFFFSFLFFFKKLYAYSS